MQALPGSAAARHHQPARQRASRRRLSEGGLRRRRHPVADLRARPQPLQHRRASEGQREEAAAADHGAYRRRHRGRVEVEVPAVQRDARRRLRLRARHRRRQGQPHRRPDDDGAAEADAGAARSRRHLPRRIGRGGQLELRHPVHGRAALRPDRRRVLLRRRRRRDAHRRRGAVRDRPGDREDPARHRADGARHLRPRLDSAEVERRSSTSRRRSRRSPSGGPSAFNETTGTYFRGLAAISPPDAAAHYRDVLSTDPKVRAAADDWLFENEPQHSSMLRTSVSPNIFAGGYRSNVIPSEAKATLDVRMLPDEEPAAFLEQVQHVIDDPAVDAHFPTQNTRPAGAAARLDSEPFKAIEAANTRIYNVPTLPTMSTVRHRHGAAARERECSATASGRRSISKTARRASACTATRNGSSRPSSIASCVQLRGDRRSRASR